MSRFSTALASSLRALTASCRLGAFSICPRVASKELMVALACSWPQVLFAATNAAYACRATSVASASSPSAHLISAILSNAVPSPSLSPVLLWISSACFAALIAECGSSSIACACASISRTHTSIFLSPAVRIDSSSRLAARSPAFGSPSAACARKPASKALAKPLPCRASRKTATASSAASRANWSLSCAHMISAEATSTRPKATLPPPARACCTMADTVSLATSNCVELAPAPTNSCTAPAAPSASLVP
mmetsp:Transcript_58204/g.166959  ORF Transcript_58204/g.166959 Transcript_58204/m.166959 type:complete len:251 (+) Transcript_58204:572-1324(+)